MDKKEELKMLQFLYQIIKDKTVQRRFDSTVSCDSKTGEVNYTRVIDRCEDYIKYRIEELLKE